MNEEIKKVLYILKEGKITKDDAVKLIEALKENEDTRTSNNRTEYISKKDLEKYY